MTRKKKCVPICTPLNGLRYIAAAMAMASGMSISHVIFDLDGLLLNTEHLYAQASSDLLHQFGREYSYELKARLMGKGPAEVADAFVRHYSLPVDAKEWEERSRAAAAQLLPTCRLLPGAAKLIHHFYKHNISMAIGTGSSEEALKIKTSKFTKLFSSFTHVVTSQDAEVERGKPAPDIYRVCASRFEDRPESSSCLVFEDAPNGLQSATAAGMPVVMVPGPWVPAEMTHGAKVVLPDLRDFSPESFGLPPFRYRTDVTHVIFDLDETLVGTNKFYLGTVRSILKQYGKLPTSFDKGGAVADAGGGNLDHFKAQVMGLSAEEAATLIIEKFKLPLTKEQYLETFNQEVMKLLPGCSLLPGAKRLVDHLHARGIPMAVATNTSAERYEATTSGLRDTFAKFSHVVTGTDPELRGRGKPAPDMFLLAAARFGDLDSGPVEPGRCLVFEDSLAGVEAASAAGVQCVLIPEENRLEPRMTVAATQVLATLEEFRPEDFGLSKFTDPC